MQYHIKTTSDTTEAVFSGKFTFVDNAAFRSVLKLFDDEKVRCLVLDLGGVEFVDSAALGMLLIARDESSRTGKALILRHPAGQVKKIFEISKFYDLFSIEQ